MEEYDPEVVRERLGTLLADGPKTARHPGVSDEEWELREALGVGVAGGR